MEERNDKWVFGGFGASVLPWIPKSPGLPAPNCLAPPDKQDQTSLFRVRREGVSLPGPSPVWYSAFMVPDAIPRCSRLFQVVFGSGPYASVGHGESLGLLVGDVRASLVVAESSKNKKTLTESNT